MIQIANPSGNKHNLRSYEKGVLSGRYIDWHPNGERWIDGNAKEGEKAGLWTQWFKNGVKKEEGVWEKGKPEGIFEEWYENGQKATEQIFKNGKLTFGLIWKPNGVKCKKSRVTQETGVLLEYNLEGEVVEERIIKYGKRVSY
jgi:antitoxin component YwqK of YwqJK toxin-antitoxin module